LYLLADKQPATQEARRAVSQNSTIVPQDEKSPSQREFAVDSPAFNEAFANAGLLRLPTGDEQKTKVDRPISRHREKPQEENETHMAKSTTYVSMVNAQPAEPALLRDLPFVLQGLSSKNLVFKNSKVLQLPVTLPVPIISLLHSLAEPCLLYKSLSEFVDSDGGGLVGQSFRAALGLELRQYLKLVASLEGQIRRALAMLDESEPRSGIGKAGVTLKRCVYWTREATMGLRLMSLMVEESKGRLPCCNKQR
jgi:gamma-tubulin complex component 3